MRYLVFVLALFALNPGTAHDSDQATVCAGDTLQASDAREGVASGIEAVGEPSFLLAAIAAIDAGVVIDDAFYAVPGVAVTEPNWPRPVMASIDNYCVESALITKIGDDGPSGFTAPARMNC